MESASWLIFFMMRILPSKKKGYIQWEIGKLCLQNWLARFRESYMLIIVN